MTTVFDAENDDPFYQFTDICWGQSMEGQNNNENFLVFFVLTKSAQDSVPLLLFETGTI